MITQIAMDPTKLYGFQLHRSYQIEWLSTASIPGDQPLQPSDDGRHILQADVTPAELVGEFLDRLAFMPVPTGEGSFRATAALRTRTRYVHDADVRKPRVPSAEDCKHGCSFEREMSPSE